MPSLPRSGIRSDTQDSEVEEGRLGWEVRPYQQAAHDAVYNEFDGGVGSTLVVMPTDS